MYTKNFFSLYKPIKKGPKIFFFPQQRDPGIFFSRGGAAWNFFFPESGLQNLFFPEKGREKIFFLDFLRAPPQIINSRPLISVVLICDTWEICLVFCKLSKSPMYQKPKHWMEL